MLRDGYAVYRGVFGEGEVADLVTGLDRASLTRSRAGARHLMSLPVVAELAMDERLLHLAGQWLGGSRNGRRISARPR